MNDNKFLIPQDLDRYRNGGLYPTTYILGARCADGVVLVGDKKVTGGTGSFTDKIRQLPRFRFIVFAAAGLETLFEEFSNELPRRVIKKLCT